MFQPAVFPIPPIIRPIQQHGSLRIIHRPIRERLVMLLHILSRRETPARLVFLKLLNHGSQLMPAFARRHHIAERKLFAHCPL